jgi:DNA-binding transcriptional MerR regulator
MPLTTRQLARHAQVAEQTVRNWSRDYGELFTPAARGETGPRVFSDEDVQVFCSIATLRREDVPPAEIVERLQRGDIYIEATPNRPQATPSPTDTPQSPQTALVALSSIQARLDAVERRQELLLRHGVLWGALLGAIATLVLGGFVLWALYLAGV